MIKQIEDLTGQVFDKLTVIEFAGRENKKTYWLCKCECGKEKKIWAPDLKNGKTKSCGCAKAEKIRQSKIIDLTGQRFSRLTVLEQAGMQCNHVLWKCLCDCGATTNVSSNALRRGLARSCGCYNKERITERNTTHDKSNTPEYNTWLNMKGRCENPNNHKYKNYGGRGIKVCQRWLNSFENFLNDMGEKPSPRHSIDRIDVNGDYAPENCRWADSKTQGRNRQYHKMVEYKGEMISVRDLADRLNTPFRLLRDRLFKLGWTIEKIENPSLPLSKETSVPIDPKIAKKDKARQLLRNAVKKGEIIKPSCCSYPGCSSSSIQGHHHKGYDEENALDVVWLCSKHHPREGEIQITAFGQTKYLREWSESSGIDRDVIYERIKRGWESERAVSEPVKKRKSK